MLPVFVRVPGEEPKAALPTDLTIDGAPRIDASAQIASSPDGPFLSPIEALRADPALRENFATALELPGIRRFVPVRALVWAGILPMLALAELDRELGVFEGPAAYVRATVGVLACVWIARDLLRPLPRHPRAIGVLYLGVAARLVAIGARHCMKSAGLVAIAAPALALASGIAVLVLAPPPRAVGRAIASALGVPETKPSIRQAPLLLPLAVAAALPIVLFAAMHVELPLFVQAAIFLAYAAFAPMALRLPKPATHPWKHVFDSAGGAFMLTLGLASAGHFVVQAISAFARCADPERWSTSLWRTLASTETLTLAHPRTPAERVLLVIMTIAFVPWAEERIYRGVLQRALAMRFGSRIGIALAAIGFGVAHLGVYRSALWQAVLLGVGFGVAFEEGGLICAVIVHAVWNVYLLL